MFQNYFLKRQTLLLFLAAILFALNGCKKENESHSSPSGLQSKLMAFTKQHLPAEQFYSLNWKSLTPVLREKTTIGWLVYPENQGNEKASYFIVAEKNLPTEIIFNQIKLKDDASSGFDVKQIEQRSFVIPKKVFLDAKMEVPQSSAGKKKLASLCDNCPTLPEVVIIAKRRVKTIYADLDVWINQRLGDNRFYYPVYEENIGGGGGIGNPEGGGYPEGGGNPDDEANYSENPPYLDPTTLTDFVLYKNLYLFTPNDYPGMEMGWPWRWWKQPNDKNEIGYYLERILELIHSFQFDDFLLQNCKELEAIMKFGPMFQQVAQFMVPQPVRDRLKQVKTQAPNLIIDNFNLQQLNEASGPVINCDFFPIKIDKIPNGMSAQQFLEYFRLNINSFVTLTGLAAAKFYPYKDGQFDDKTHWEKRGTESVGALVSIDMANNGSVILSDYSNKVNEDGSQSHSFTFSTLETPLDLEHPVAGNRRFGIYSNPSSPNSFTFYTMGVDRTWDVWFRFLNFRNLGFIQADKLWSNIQDNLVSFINSNGGVASVYNPKEHISRPDFQDIEAYLMGNISLIELKKRLGCP